MPPLKDWRFGAVFPNTNETQPAASPQLQLETKPSQDVPLLVERPEYRHEGVQRGRHSPSLQSSWLRIRRVSWDKPE